MVLIRIEVHIAAKGLIVMDNYVHLELLQYKE